MEELQVARLLAENTRRQHTYVEARGRQLIDEATSQGNAAASRGMAQRADSTELLGGITCPTLVIVGEQDALIPPAVTQDYASRIPGAQFAVIPQAGHLSNLEQPEAFLQAIGGFLRMF